MNATLVGLFDTQADATAAHGKLMAAGFAASALSLTGGGNASTATSSGGSSSAMTTSGHQASGGIAKFFENLFGADDVDETDRVGHTSTYTEAFNRGSFALTVKTNSESEVDKAESILNAAGAIDVDERADEWRRDGWAGGAAGSVGALSAGSTGNAYASTSSLEAGGTQKLQEVQEELKVGKRAIARGGVRVFTRLTEVPVEESVMLREEHADIKRTSVDRVAGEADLAAFKEGSIEVREMAEEAVVSKTARVTGEVEVGKTATEREEVIRDTVRQTKVEVEQIAAGSVTTDALTGKR